MIQQVITEEQEREAIIHRHTVNQIGALHYITLSKGKNKRYVVFVPFRPWQYNRMLDDIAEKSPQFTYMYEGTGTERDFEKEGLLVIYYGDLSNDEN